MTPEQMDQLMNRLVQKLVDEGYINTDQPQANETARAAREMPIERWTSRSRTNPSISSDSRR